MDHLAAQTLPGEGKSSLAFRTISEVSVEIDVPQHVLRFWESRFSQVRPMKRGGGRRYYRPEDIELLRQIKTYLYKHGYTIKGVQRLLKEHKMRDHLPSLSAYRIHAAQMTGDHTLEAPHDALEDFEQTFEATLTDVTIPEPAAPIPGTQLQSSLAAITQLRDEIAVPPEPMRLEAAAERVAEALALQPDAFAGVVLIDTAMAEGVIAESALQQPYAGEPAVSEIPVTLSLPVENTPVEIVATETPPATATHPIKNESAPGEIPVAQTASATVHELSPPQLAAKETGYMTLPPEPAPAAAAHPPAMPEASKAELGEILAELHALRDLLRAEAA